MHETGTSAEEPKRGSSWLPLFFALLAVVLGIAAVITGVREREQGERTPPPALAGKNESINVVEAFRAQGLKAEIAKGFVPRGVFQAPGQEVVVDGVPSYVFIFEEPDLAKADAAKPDAAKALPRGATPVAGGPLVVQGSNVIVVLNGGDEALRQKVTAAVQGLP